MRQQIISSLRWTAVAKFSGQLVNWAVTLLVIRLLLPSDYGLLAMANVIIGLLVMVAEMGFGASLVQSADLERYRVRQVFGAGLALNFVFCVGLIAAAPALAAFFDEPRLVPIVRVLALRFVISAVGLVPDAMLRREMRYKRVSLIEMASDLGGHVATLALALLGYGVWSLVLGGLTTTLMRALILQLSAPERILPTFALRGSRHLLSFGAGITVTRFLWYIFLQTDIVIAGKLLGKEAVGMYSVSVHLASLPMQRVGSIVNDVAFSAFARIQHDRDAIASNVLLAVRMIALLAFPALWGLACVAPELVQIAMGAKWLAAILPLQIVSLAVPLRMVGTVVSTATISVGRVDIAMLTMLFGTLIAPPLFYAGTSYGIAGVSIVWAALSPMMLSVNLYRALATLSLNQARIWAGMARPVAATVVMAAAVLAIRMPIAESRPGLRLAAAISTGVVVYAVATVLINRSALREAFALLFARESAKLPRAQR
jgi:O-antigen/teichoic acid export membrane protein